MLDWVRSDKEYKWDTDDKTPQTIYAVHWYPDRNKNIRTYSYFKTKLDAMQYASDLKWKQGNHDLKTIIRVCTQGTFEPVDVRRMHERKTPRKPWEKDKVYYDNKLERYITIPYMHPPKNIPVGFESDELYEDN